MKNIFLKGLVASFALAVSGFANAGLIVYTDESSWLAAVGALDGTISFNDVTSDLAIDEATYEYDIFNIQESGSGFLLLDAMAGYASSGVGIDNTTFLSMVGGYTASSSMNVTFDLSLTSLGFDTYNYDCGNENSNISVNGSVLGNTPTSGGCPSGTLGFFGVVGTDDTLISTLSFLPLGSGVYNGFDNFSYTVAKTTDVPEPSTIAVFALGLMGLASRKFIKRV